MKVCAPSTPEDAYGLLRSAIEDPDPVIFIENLPTYRTPAAFELPDANFRVPLGKAAVQREGTDVTVISYARIAGEARAAAELAAAQGVSAEVIDLRTIAPWERETVLASARKTGRVLIAHEAVKEYGVGAEMAAVIHDELFGVLKKPVKRMGGAFCPVPYSKPLEMAFAPDAQRIAAAIVELAQ
jgi:pyruvate dehydrogenase E1 component beta subunit